MKRASAKEASEAYRRSHGLIATPKTEVAAPKDGPPKEVWVAFVTRNKTNFFPDGVTMLKDEGKDWDRTYKYVLAKEPARKKRK